ncbi:sortase domain-bontaining protein [Streptomyces sp. NPDC085460]|uniref:sortase domain-containing protein n=1 Tax=Streptomyces sp. NPDC085460 TaxID=3365723 RepID=UPI0037D1D7A8
MTRTRRTRRATTSAAVASILLALLVALLGGCAATAGSGAPASSDAAPPEPAPAASRPPPARTAGQPEPVAAAPTPRPRPAELDIPAIGVTDLRVVPYEGKTDDRAGTRIQDRGVAASPYGKDGGVGPGDVGNYQVTAHRLSAGGALRDLPDVDVGDLVRVTAEGTTYTYRITETRTTSFRSARSLAEQRAAVPGAPGERPTRAMITLSTCATPEDDAAGNFWRDALGNPEHRIDKIGVLTTTDPARR